MRLLAILLLTCACITAYAMELTAADLTAMAEKSKTMKVGETSSIPVKINGKTVYIGLVMGAAGVTFAGEGIVGGTLKFLYTDKGVVVQVAEKGLPPKTMLVADGKVGPAPAGVVFGSAAVATATEVQAEKAAAVTTATTAEAKQAAVQAQNDFNSVSTQIVSAFANLSTSTTSTYVPTFADAAVTQNNSNTTNTIVTGNASGATNP